MLRACYGIPGRDIIILELAQVKQSLKIYNSDDSKKQIDNFSCLSASSLIESTQGNFFKIPGFSANKRITGSITKQGSKHVRRMLVQVVHAISQTRNSRLKSFFLRIKAKKGTKVAVVALARKVLCILHHLLVNREMYKESGNIKPKPLKFDRTSLPIQIIEQDMIDALVKVGYIIKKMDKEVNTGVNIILPYHDESFLHVVKQHRIRRFS